MYDVANNAGWVSVGDSADTAEFAVESIRRWWNTLGRDRFPTATRLLITADAGGSNGYRPRAWKWFLAQLAAETGLEITVVHYPPGTSKWNKIEHRLFSYITMNWRGRPLTDIATIIELIASTTTQTGLTVQAAYDPGWYQRGHQDHQHTNGTTAPAPPQLARRMELHHHTQLNTRPNSRRTLSVKYPRDQFDCCPVGTVAEHCVNFASALAVVGVMGLLPLSGSQPALQRTLQQLPCS